MHDPQGLGLHLSDLIAGFAGGLVNAFAFRRSDPWSIVGSIVIGACTANYLGEPAARVTGFSQGAAAFLVGVAGMALVQGIVKAAQNYRWMPPPPGSEGNKP